MFRAYRKVVSVTPDTIHDPGFYFENTNRAIALMTRKANSFYQMATHETFDLDDTPDGQLRGMMKQAFENVVRSIPSQSGILAWTGENEYIKKWDGKLLPARFASLLEH